MAKNEITITWGIRKRLQFIEFQLLFKRQIKSSTLMNEFGISRQQSSTDIKLYKTLHSGNLLPYAPSEKSYKPSRSFSPHYISENLTEDAEEAHRRISATSSIETIPTLKRTQIKGLLTKIMSAVELNENIEFIYSSARSPFGKKRRVKPLAIAYVGNRPHLRAYCFDNNEHRDFVLSRFNTIPNVFNNDKEYLTEDKLWHETLLIELIPNPKLVQDGQDLISKEYNLGAIGSYNIRKSLIHYFFKHNNLPCCKEDMEISLKEPWAFPLLVKNWEQCKKFIIN